MADFSGKDTPGKDAEEPSEPELTLPTAEDIERIHAEAHRQGYEHGHQQGTKEGHEAGYAAGQAVAREEARRLTGAAERLESALSRIDAEVADELLALAIEIARQVARAELRARPDAILNVVREALSQLPHQHAAIFLNPEDASLLRSYMGDQLTHAGHRIHEDIKLQRGDCVVEAGGSHLDATVATRWRRALENLGIESAWNADGEA